MTDKIYARPKTLQRRLGRSSPKAKHCCVSWRKKARRQTQLRPAPRRKSRAIAKHRCNSNCRRMDALVRRWYRKDEDVHPANATAIVWAMPTRNETGAFKQPNGNHELTQQRRVVDWQLKLMYFVRAAVATALGGLIGLGTRVAWPRSRHPPIWRNTNPGKQLPPGQVAYRECVCAGMVILGLDNRPTPNLAECQQAINILSLEKGVVMIIGKPQRNHFAVFRGRGKRR